jgi:acetyl esterase/lipase
VIGEYVPREVTLDMIPALRAPEVSLLICLPTGAATPVPAIYNIHGGGMIMGDNRMGLLEMLEWAGELSAALISVEYRLAPETPHPGPVEDCYAGLAWTADHAGELGIDPDRIVVAGGSAGGRVQGRGRVPAQLAAPHPRALSSAH